ncbi:putative Ubiquitin-like domain, replication termination factor 2, Ubiquitin-like domain superfamily [Helianthus annuus]|uniref:Ubiquitin domain, replication termination factor 2, Ubiquitin-like domain superfamily n=1 Tax=Helianthus annuus TaxID=4232 RepID=A0A251SQB2_HELAN|nr:replication termination factor 2 [Helianthus annuus]KAF5772804.1 putative Ubiquitin domain, replication termination factor 2, Ubiquitin-like domain superfamily [Helianthus annuus]KAJ0476383.1 putative Ubiquitin-like domain, replication termination factor 2, Ubiquitin-like domain superfamily [Helianthus annuus]KAJ0497205.1 putative Ubiquitin-like domain, replication termination factor 2, Ubiquitin-like domain superfamily [Helianthus annuus]KAJ0857624.1 putative Ubiquitin-like domain, replicat
MNSNTHNLQIFIQAPDLQSPIRSLTLTLTPSFTIHNLKQSFFSQIDSTNQNPTSSTFFTFNGRVLSDSETIQSAGISNLSTLGLRFRLPGGGGDGGATGAESRDCYLNMYADKKPDKVDPNEQRLSKWLNCALSNEPLKRPIVVDYLGNVFNKQALVEALLKKNVPKAFGYIKGLKDMISVELESIPGTEGADSDVKFQCPVTGLEFNGKYKFYALKSCGHVLSAKALKEIKSSSCHVCRKEFAEADKIVINGNEEEVIALREKMEIEKLKVREKKAKVKKVKNANGNENAGGDGDSGVCEDVVRVIGSKREIDVKAAKVSGKIETNEKVVNGKNEAKRFKAADLAPANANKEVYASIFTSSRKSDFKETYSCRSLPLGRN